MKQCIFISLLLVAVLAFGSTAFAGNRLIAVFADGTPDVEMEAAIVSNGGAGIQHLGIINGVAFTLPAKASDKARAAILAHNKVVRLDDDVMVQAVKKPSDKPGGGKPGGGGDDPPPPPPQETPWGIDRIGADLAWATSTGAGVKVCVIDTGIDSGHPDLAANYKGGYNAINSRKSPKDDNGHGTHCAGTIAAVNNDIGVVGVAPDASLYAVKALDRRGSGYLSDIIEGLEWAVTNGMNVVSMSLSTDSDIPAFHDAIDATYEAEVILVAAAGNDGGSVDYPAAYATCIAVSATGDYQAWAPSDALASFSNFGPEIDFAAPGVAILSTVKGGEYEEKAGTSMACPHVAGVVALVLGSNPAFTSAEVLTRMANTATDLGPAGWDMDYGYGLIDAYAASQ